MATPRLCVGKLPSANSLSCGAWQSLIPQHTRITKAPQLRAAGPFTLGDHAHAPCAAKQRAFASALPPVTMRLRQQNAIRLDFNPPHSSRAQIAKRVSPGHSITGNTACGAVRVKIQTYRVFALGAASSAGRGPPRPSPAACNALASDSFLACFASIEALLTRRFPRCLRRAEPTMQTVQTDRSTLAKQERETKDVMRYDPTCRRGRPWRRNGGISGVLREAIA